jgi:hypothetical protein
MYRQIQVYFTDNRRLIAGQLPYEVRVPRVVLSSADPFNAVLDEFFKGPSDVERNQGLAVISNGFTGYSRIELANGVVHVYLEGTCQSNGTLYTIERPLMQNLKQFPEIQFVKIYDQSGNTRQPAARVDSVPACLDPNFRPSPTPLPTSTLASRTTPTPTRTARPPLILTATPYRFPTPPYR